MVQSEYKYVSWHEQRKRWVAQVLATKKRKALYQYFDPATAAADVVKKTLGLTQTSDMKSLLDT